MAGKSGWGSEGGRSACACACVAMVVVLSVADGLARAGDISSKSSEQYLTDLSPSALPHLRGVLNRSHGHVTMLFLGDGTKLELKDR